MSKQKFLEKILSNFGSRPPPSDGIADQAYMNSSPLVRARISAVDGYSRGIKREAARALYNLTDAIYTETPRYLKGTTFKDMSDKVFEVLMDFFDNVPTPIDAQTVALVDKKIEDWFDASTTNSHEFIPCDITPHYARPFVVGPVTFRFQTDFAQNLPDTPISSFAFEQMFEAMQQYHAYWMAEVDIVDTHPKRAAEIGNLTVDLALVAIQLLVPHDESARVGRLYARRTPSMHVSAALVNGEISGGSRNQQPGRAIAGPTFEWILSEKSAILNSIGRRVSAFLDEGLGLARLNQSWNDAAYWFHEGMAETLDTIAVPKLETAIEVLLRAVSSRGSEARITHAIKTFYGLKPDDLLAPDSLVTVKQFSKGLVSDRSRLLHGTLSTLSTDMRVSRSSLTVLAHELLINFSLQLDQYVAAGETGDDIDPFLEWVTGRRAV